MTFNAHAAAVDGVGFAAISVASLGLVTAAHAGIAPSDETDAHVFLRMRLDRVTITVADAWAAHANAPGTVMVHANDSSAHVIDAPGLATVEPS